MMSDLQTRLAAAVGDRYAVEAEIGRGGMGVVYRALDRRLKRRVAIKVLPPDLAFRIDVRSRFLREAQTAARLSHPHIVPIYEVDERAGLVYFVMALIDGESLAARLARSGRPPVATVVRVMRDVADALAGAHARGVIHRDIKPDNILLEPPTDRATVTDFGIARAIEGSSRLTITGIAVGTPAYMSPEQALGERDIDGRSDIYSLAVVGYQMLTGEPPFVASNTPALLQMQVSDLPAPLAGRRPDIPPALAEAITRALAKEPGGRWPDAATFRDELARIAASPGAAGTVARPATSVGAPGPAARSGAPAPKSGAGEVADAPPSTAPAAAGAEAPAGGAEEQRPEAPAAGSPPVGGEPAGSAPAAAGVGGAVPSSERSSAEPVEDLWHVARVVPAARGIRPPTGEGRGAPPRGEDHAAATAGPHRNPASRDEPSRPVGDGSPPLEDGPGGSRKPLGDGARRPAPDPRVPLRGAPERPAPPAPARPSPQGAASLPPWMPDSWRDARRQWREEARRGGMRGGLADAEGARRAGVVRDGRSAEPPVEQRIVAFRRQTASTAIRVGVLAAINAVTTPFFPWFLFPASIMGLRLAHRGSGLWADGVRFKDVFGPEADAQLRRKREEAAPPRLAGAAGGPSVDALALRLAPREVVEGPFGDVVRVAAADQRAAQEALEKLSKTDRELIPDVEPTLKDLAERVGALAHALHRLDADVQPGALEEIERRIAQARAAGPATGERERTIALLERQRSTLAALRERRDALAGQLESASLMLQNMKLDLLALRSAGVQASLDSASSTTQEARELSREIGYVLGAAKEIRGARRED